MDYRHQFVDFPTRIDQETKKGFDILEINYGQTPVDKVNGCVRDWLDFKEVEFNSDDKFCLSDNIQ